jgi:hypothetical protein
MPEKFSLRFADYFDGADAGQFGLTADAADFIIIFIQRVQRSDLDLMRCGKAKPLNAGKRRPAAMIEFGSRHRVWRLIASADPGPMFELRFKWVAGSAWTQVYCCLDHNQPRIDYLWEMVQHYESLS